MSKSRALHAKFKEQVGHVFRLVAAADGLVDVKGLCAAFKALGTHLTAAEAQQLLEKVDWDCDGFVDLDEFTRAATGLVAIEGADSADDVASKGQSQSQIRTEPTSPSTPLALNVRRQSGRPGGHMLTETAKRWEWWAGAGTSPRTNSHDSVHSATDSVGAGAVTAGVARARASPSRSAQMDVPPSLPLWSSDRLRKQKLRQREAKRGSEGGVELEMEMEMERAAWDEAADGDAHAHVRGGGAHAEGEGEGEEEEEEEEEDVVAAVLALAAREIAREKENRGMDQKRREKRERKEERRRKRAAEKAERARVAKEDRARRRSHRASDDNDNDFARSDGCGGGAGGGERGQPRGHSGEGANGRGRRWRGGVFRLFGACRAREEVVGGVEG